MTGKVLLARQPDWRSRQRRVPVAATPPASRRRDPVEFDEIESDPASNDGGWTVGYLDVLLLLVTLFAALLGATYFQINQLRTAQAPEAEALATLSPAEPTAAALVQKTDAAIPPHSLVPDSTSDSAVDATPDIDAAPGVATSPAEADTPVAATGNESGDEPGLESAHEKAGEDPLQALQIVDGPAIADSIGTVTVETLIEPRPELAVPPQFKALMDLVATHAETENLDLLLDRHQLRLEVGDGILFNSGTADLGTGGQALIAELVTAMEDDRLKISVEGHTDDVPINTPRFPSNWELSSTRAITVARQLIALGIPQHRIRVTGYADTRPRAPNDSSANRALNRRVSLVLEVSDETLADS